MVSAEANRPLRNSNGRQSDLRGKTAAPLFCEQILADDRIGGFSAVLASHLGALHAMNAVSVLTERLLLGSKPPDPRFFESL